MPLPYLKNFNKVDYIIALETTRFLFKEKAVGFTTHRFEKTMQELSDLWFNQAIRSITTTIEHIDGAGVRVIEHKEIFVAQ